MTPEAKLILAIRKAEEYASHGAPFEGAIYCAAGDLGVDEYDLRAAWIRKLEARRGAVEALRAERREREAIQELLATKGKDPKRSEHPRPYLVEHSDV